MVKGIQNIALSPSQDNPFEKLMLSRSNVRRIKAGVSLYELAADIVRSGLLQSLSVRPVLDNAGIEPGSRSQRVADVSRRSRCWRSRRAWPTRR